MQPGIEDRQAVDPLRHCHGVDQADRAAPVLHHHRDVPEVQPLDEFRQPLDMPVDDVPVVVRDLVALTEADVVGRDTAVASREQHRDEFAIDIAPGRLPMQEQGNRRILRPFIHIVGAQTVPLQVIRRKRIVRQAVECFVRGAVNIDHETVLQRLCTTGIGRYDYAIRPE